MLKVGRQATQQLLLLVRDTATMLSRLLLAHRGVLRAMIKQHWWLRAALAGRDRQAALEVAGAPWLLELRAAACSQLAQAEAQQPVHHEPQAPVRTH